MENVKKRSFKKTRPSYDQKSVCSDNLGQNKIEKFSKTG